MVVPQEGRWCQLYIEKIHDENGEYSFEKLNDDKIDDDGDDDDDDGGDDDDDDDDGDDDDDDDDDDDAFTFQMDDFQLPALRFSGV